MQNTSTHTDYAKHQHTHRYMIYTNLYKCCNFIQLTNHFREHLIAQGLGSKLEAKTRVPESIFSVSRLISWRYELSEFHWQLEQLGIFPNSSIWYDVLLRVEYYWYIRANWLMYNTTSKYIYVKKRLIKTYWETGFLKIKRRLRCWFPVQVGCDLRHHQVKRSHIFAKKFNGSSPAKSICVHEQSKLQENVEVPVFLLIQC